MNTATNKATDTRIRTTEPQRAVLLYMLDPVAFPLASGRHGSCCNRLGDMGFIAYDMERGPDGRQKGWSLTPAGIEKAEALRAVDRVEFG